MTTKYSVTDSSSVSNRHASQHGVPSEGEARSSAIRVVATLEDLSRLVAHSRKTPEAVAKQICECLAALCVLSRSQAARSHIRNVSARAFQSVFTTFEQTPTVLQGLCDLVWSMAYNDAETQGLFASTGVTALLLQCTKANRENVSLMKSALGAVSSLCRHPANQQVAASEELTQVLLFILTKQGFNDSILLQYALDATASIAHGHEANSKSFSDPRCYKMITETLINYRCSAEIVRSACIVLVVLRECENGSNMIVTNSGIEAVIGASQLHMSQPELQHIVCALIGQLIREVPRAVQILVRNRGIQTLLTVLKHYANHWMIAEACCLLLITITRSHGAWRKLRDGEEVDQSSETDRLVQEAAEQSEWSGLTQVMQHHRKRPSLVIAAIRTMSQLGRYSSCAKRLHECGGITGSLAALAHIRAAVGTDIATLAALASYDKRSTWVAPDSSQSQFSPDQATPNETNRLEGTSNASQQVYDVLLAALALLSSKAAGVCTVATATNVCAFVSGPDSIACIEGLFSEDGEHSLAALQVAPAVYPLAEVEWAASGVITLLSFMQHPRSVQQNPEAKEADQTSGENPSNLVFGMVSYGKILPMVHTLYSFLSQELLNTRSPGGSRSSHGNEVLRGNHALRENRRGGRTSASSADAVWPRLVTDSLHWLRQSRQTLRNGNISACSSSEWDVVTAMCRFLACALQNQRQAALRSMASGGGVTLMLQLQRQCRDLRKGQNSRTGAGFVRNLKIRKDALLEAIVVVLRSIGNGNVSTATPYSSASLIAAYSKLKSKRNAQLAKIRATNTACKENKESDLETVTSTQDSTATDPEEDVDEADGKSLHNRKEDELVIDKQTCQKDVDVPKDDSVKEETVEVDENDDEDDDDDDDDEEEDEDLENMSDTSSEEEGDDGSEEVVDKNLSYSKTKGKELQVKKSLSFHVPSSNEDSSPGLGNFVVKLPMLKYDNPPEPEPYTAEEDQLDPTVAQARSIPQEIDLSTRKLVYDWEAGDGAGYGAARSRVPPAVPYRLPQESKPLQDMGHNFLASPLDDGFPVPNTGEHVLYFESRFESANLFRAIKITDWEYDLVLRSDVHTKAHHQWFYFAIANTHPPGMENDHVRYKFNIVNFTKPNSMFNYGMKPVRYSFYDEVHKRRGWCRDGDDIAYFGNSYLQPNGGTKASSTYFTLTFTMVFKHPTDTLLVAMCYPYSYSKLQHFLEGLEREKHLNKCLRREELCKTPGGLRCDLLSITDFDASKDEMAARRAIVFTARVHPGEVNASFMMEGTIRFLVSLAPLARILRQKYIFKVVPMLNPDGVYHGNTRVSLAGCDLNRMWASPNAAAHPEIYNAKQMIKALQTTRKVSVYVDFHGHSRKKSIFMYGVDSHGKRRSRDSSATSHTGSGEGGTRATTMSNTLGASSAGASSAARASGPDSGGSAWYSSSKVGKTSYVREYPRLIAASPHAGCTFSYDDCSFHIHKGHDTAARVVMARELGIKASYTLEASFCGPGDGTRNTSRHNTHFSPADFGSIGVGLCDALLRFHDSGAHAEMLANFSGMGIEPLKVCATPPLNSRATCRPNVEQQFERKRWVSGTKVTSASKPSGEVGRTGKARNGAFNKGKLKDRVSSITQLSDIESDREPILTKTKTVLPVTNTSNKKSSNNYNNLGVPEEGRGEIERKPSQPAKQSSSSSKRSGRRGRLRISKKSSGSNSNNSEQDGKNSRKSSGKSSGGSRKGSNSNARRRKNFSKTATKVQAPRRSDGKRIGTTATESANKTSRNLTSKPDGSSSGSSFPEQNAELSEDIHQLLTSVTKERNQQVDDHDTALAKRVGASSLDAARRRNSTPATVLGLTTEFHLDRSVASKLRNAAVNAKLIRQASLRMGLSGVKNVSYEAVDAQWGTAFGENSPVIRKFGKDFQSTLTSGVVVTTLPACKRQLDTLTGEFARQPESFLHDDTNQQRPSSDSLPLLQRSGSGNQIRK